MTAASKYVIRNAYQPTLRLALAHPISSTALALSLMLCTAGLVVGGHIKFVFMPEIGADWVTISVNMPQGTTATQTAKVVRHIEEKAIVLRDQIDAEREASTRAQPRGGDSIYRNFFHLHRRPTLGPAFFLCQHSKCWRPRASSRSYHRTFTFRDARSRQRGD